ncbi:MAG: FIST C-terminal domain-containing protein [Azospirillum sp.]|nr:FIST C-terminal domain-containing protein [Azospirillum sp.]
MAQIAPAVAFAQTAGSDPANWGALAVELGEKLARDLPGGRLGFLYATDALADRLEDILAVVKRVSGIGDWVGSVGSGVLGEDEVFDAPALVALALDLPRETYRLVPNLTEPGETPADLEAWIAGAKPALGVVHADPRCGGLSEILGDLAETSGAFLAGGLSSGERGLAQIAGKVVDEGASGVLIGRDVRVAMGLSQGCVPLGPVHRATAAEDNVLMTIDGRPALEVFKEAAGIVRDHELRAAAAVTLVAFPTPGRDERDYLVRHLTGIDPERGLIAVGHAVEPGDRLFFVRRDAAAARRDLETMLARAKAAVGRPKAGLYFSCLARGPNMFGPGSAERAILRDSLGNIPIAGMFCNGEISNARLYGYTGVLALFG